MEPCGNVIVLPCFTYIQIYAVIRSQSLKQFSVIFVVTLKPPSAPTVPRVGCTSCKRRPRQRILMFTVLWSGSWKHMAMAMVNSHLEKEILTMGILSSIIGLMTISPSAIIICKITGEIDPSRHAATTTTTTSCLVGRCDPQTNHPSTCPFLTGPFWGCWKCEFCQWWKKSNLVGCFNPSEKY